MSNNKKRYAATVSFEAVLAEQMKDLEFAREYEALRPEFEVIDQVIKLRLKRRLTQRQLAERMGTPQPSIARMESQRKVRNLDFVRRLADALDARLEVRLIPKEAEAKTKAKRAKVA